MTVRADDKRRSDPIFAEAAIVELVQSLEPRDAGRRPDGRHLDLHRIHERPVLLTWVREVETVRLRYRIVPEHEKLWCLQVHRFSRTDSPDDPCERVEKILCRRLVQGAERAD